MTNFYRTFGGPLTLVVILSDAVKAVVAVLFAMWIAGAISPELVTLGKYWAGLFCLLGHMFPITFQFRGGKGILSGGTIALMIDWRVALVVWGGFLILAFLTRYVSLGSCWAGLSFPFVTGFVYQDTLITVLAIIIGGLILFKHRSNMVRLIKGTESKFTRHKKEETSTPEEPVVEEHQHPAEPSAQAEVDEPEQEGKASTQEETSVEEEEPEEEKELQEGEA